jgi:hypothetical protein
VSGSTVYAGGYFTSVGGQTRNRIAAIDALGNATGWNPDASGSGNFNVRALAVSGSTVYAGGYFTSIGGQTRNRIAALDASGNATGWNPTAGWNPDAYPDEVYALAVSSGKVYIGGAFTNVGPYVLSNVARLNR